MPLIPSSIDIVVRLLLTALASALIGYDRETHGHAAGLRTTILVGLAAAIAMIQANVLLSVSGKTPSSFGVMDLMRMPLGILTGVGFIGGGAILRKGAFIKGVTTAATLWVTTVIGLCLGGGQILLGIEGTALVLFTLSILRSVEKHIAKEQLAIVVVECSRTEDCLQRLPHLLSQRGYTARVQQQHKEIGIEKVYFSFEIRWKKSERHGPPADLITVLNENFSVYKIQLSSESRLD